MSIRESLSIQITTPFEHMLLTNILLPGTLSGVVVEHLVFFIGRQHNKQPLESNGAVLQGGGEPARLGLPVDAHEVYWHCKNVHI